MKHTITFFLFTLIILNCRCQSQTEIPEFLFNEDLIAKKKIKSFQENIKIDSSFSKIYRKYDFSESGKLERIQYFEGGIPTRVYEIKSNLDSNYTQIYLEIKGEPFYYKMTSNDIGIKSLYRNSQLRGEIISSKTHELSIAEMKIYSGSAMFGNSIYGFDNIHDFHFMRGIPFDNRIDSIKFLRSRIVEYSIWQKDIRFNRMIEFSTLLIKERRSGKVKFTSSFLMPSENVYLCYTKYSRSGWPKKCESNEFEIDYKLKSGLLEHYKVRWPEEEKLPSSFLKVEIEYTFW